MAEYESEQETEAEKKIFPKVRGNLTLKEKTNQNLPVAENVEVQTHQLREQVAKDVDAHKAVNFCLMFLNSLGSCHYIFIFKQLILL